MTCTTNFVMSLLFVVVSQLSGQTEISETHEFGEPNVQWYIYSAGKTWEFEAENTMMVETVEVKSVLASDGGTFHIEVHIGGEVIAKWDQYVNDVHYQPYFHSKQVSQPLSAGDQIVYKIYGNSAWTPVGGILGINYVKLTGVTEAGGEPNIVVSPDTLFLQVGDGNSSSTSTGVLPQPLDDKSLLIQAHLLSGSIADKALYAMHSSLATAEPETLTNAFEGPLVIFSEQWQTYYEATKLIPQSSCTLEKLRFGFANYAEVEQSKKCEFFVWNDDSGKPGTLLWSTEGTITLAADRAAWIGIDVSQEGLTVDTFWMGHYEKSSGPPSSLSDSVVTRGTNFYSSDGSDWQEDNYDYLHQAVVSYGTSELEAVAQLTLQNTGSAGLQVTAIQCSKDWITPENSGSFEVGPKEQESITIRCSAEELTDGRHNGMIQITSNDPDTPVYEVPLVFDVNIWGLAPPQNLTAWSPDNTVFLNWQPPASSSPDAYQLYRSETSPVLPEANNFLATVNGNTTTYHDTDSALDAGEQFYYAVTAVYAGNESPPCQEMAVVVKVVQEPATAIPAEFSLEQNYPNPFNPATEIRFALPQARHVSLRVYNVLGEGVRTLADRPYEAGRHRLSWDGRDDVGKPVSSGIYLYQIQAGDFIDTRKMSLLR